MRRNEGNEGEIKKGVNEWFIIDIDIYFVQLANDYLILFFFFSDME